MARNIVFKDEDTGEDILKNEEAGVEIVFKSDPVEENPLLPKKDLGDLEGQWHKPEVKEEAVGEEKPDDEAEIEAKAQRIREASMASKPDTKPDTKPDDAALYKRGMLAAEIKAATYEMNDLRQKLIEADEEGDTAKKYELEEKVMELRDSKRDMQAALDNLPEDKPAASPKERASSTQDKEQQPLAMSAARWMARNPWFDNPTTDSDREKVEFANAIYPTLIKKYKDPENPELYKEATRMIDKQFSKPRKQERQPPVGGVTPGAGGGKKRLEIGVNEAAIADSVLTHAGLDIKNPDTALAYVNHREQRKRESA